jgi:hypothetical protein
MLCNILGVCCPSVDQADAQRQVHLFQACIFEKTREKQPAWYGVDTPLQSA